MVIRNSLYQYSLENIQSLLDKVRIFNFRIGDYQKHDFSEIGNCLIHLNNGSIYFTPDELKANKIGQLDYEMMVIITGRFEYKPEK